MEIESANRDQFFYVAVLLFKASSSAVNDNPLYEESFILIKATTLDEAKEKALVYGNQEQCTYQNEFGDTISWSFMQIVDISSVLQDIFNDETELYSRHFRNYDAYKLFEPLMSSDDASKL